MWLSTERRTPSLGQRRAARRRGSPFGASCARRTQGTKSAEGPAGTAGVTRRTEDRWGQTNLPRGPDQRSCAAPSGHPVRTLRTSLSRPIRRRAPAHGEHPSLTSHTPRRVRLRELSHAREKRAQPSNHHDAGRRRGGGVLAARRQERLGGRQRAGGRASDRNTARARRGATARRRRGRPPHTSQLVEGLRAGPRAAGRAEAGLPPGQHERLVRHLAGGARASAGAEPPGRSARRAEVTAGKPPRALPRGLGVLGASRGL
ncbi:unnamed protein product, partial [Prorocentrum cordatum]